MFAAGLQLDFHETAVIGRFQHPVGQPGLAAGGSRLQRNTTEPTLAFDVIRQSSAIRRQPPFKHREINLAGLTGAQLGAQPRGGFRRAREQHDAGHRAVEALHEPEKDPARLVVTLLDPRFGQVQQIGGSGLISLGQEPGRLVQDQQMVVLMEHGPAFV